MTEPILEAVEVSKSFPVGRGRSVQAVERVSLRLEAGRIVGLVGESGSGKTTLARMLALFYRPTDGRILLRGAETTSSRKYHKDVQLIFQDPFGSLNDLRSVAYTIGRALRIHRGLRGRGEIEAATVELLEQVNLTPAGEFLRKLPHELSGGQRQRVVIARALAVGPSVLLGDEPISMLDVSIRLDVLNLLAGLRDDHDLAILYITHDIASARYLCDEINVMYAGQLVEGGPADDVIKRPRHPYTRLLVECAPDPDGGRRAFDEEAAAGEPPSLADPPGGCRFHPRCPHAMPVCGTEFPPRTEFESGHWTHCWLYE